MSNYGPDDVDELNDWANRAYDMLARAQQAKQVPMTAEHISLTWELLVDNNTDDIVLRFARELEAHHHIGGEA